MRTWKRGSIEIVGEILQSLNKNPIKKSHIAFKCNLDTRTLNKYLDIIIHLGLIKKTKDLRHFVITEKGIKFLEQYHALNKLISQVSEDSYEQDVTKLYQKIKRNL